MNILFRTDSSNNIGAGHVMRDLVLAKQFENDNIFFATQALEGNINHKIKQENYKIIKLESNDVNEIIGIVKKKKIDMVVIDHYQNHDVYEKMLKNATGVKILSLDDTYEKHHCDILLNHNISADASRYEGLVPKKCEIRCGREFTLLREEFINEKKANKLHIFLAMGGVDHANVNIKILRVLSGIKNIKVHMITMNTNQYLIELKEYISDKPWIKLHIDSKKMAKLMRKCDFAILTPSVTVHEAIYMNLPFIAIKTVDNQEDMCHYLKEKKYLCLKRFDIEKLEKSIYKIIGDIDNIGQNE